MRKRLICLVSFICLFSVFNPTVCKGMVDIESNNISIGDYIQLGKYRDIPILWRYVANDENGKLILSDKVLCIKDFDSVPTNSIGSHTTIPTSDDYPHGYKNAGSNYWSDSNIRSWLNSKAPAGEVEWLCGNPPDLYADEMGFLSDGNFSQSERSVIKKVRHKTLLDDTYPGCADGGDSSYWDHLPSSSYHLYDFINDNYTNICYEYNNDMMFLLDTNQLHNMMQNSALLGCEYYIARIVPELMEYDSNINAQNFNPDNSSIYNTYVEYLVGCLQSHADTATCPYFLRTPYPRVYKESDSDGKPIPYKNGSMVIESCRALEDSIQIIQSRSIEDGVQLIPILCNNISGIRPAFYLNENNTRIISGSGTEDDPYVLTGKFENNEIYDKSLFIKSNYNTPPKISVFLNGSKLELDKYVGYERGKSKIPLRAVLEAMGATVEWDDDSHTITVYYNNNTYEMNLDHSTIRKNDHLFTTRFSPRERNGTSFMDARLLENFFDVTVNWSYADQAFYITQH